MIKNIMRKIGIVRHGSYLATVSLGIAVLALFSAPPNPALADDITVNGNPGALIINAAMAGFQPDAANDATTTYGVNITTDNMKITGAIDTAMPAQTTLKVTLAAPTGATSVGQATLSTSTQDLVTGLLIGTNQSGLSITYEFSATVEAGVIPSSSKTITLTIISS